MAKRNKQQVIDDRWAKKYEQGKPRNEKFAEERHIDALQAKTQSQKVYLKSLNENIITVATGHSGSGKTYCATYRACQLLNSGFIDRIILTRPYAHLGKDAGAVPGGDFEKYAPMVRPMLDVCKKTLGEGKYQYCIDKEIIEICPLEKIQGRSFDEPCAIIADEMQNATRAQSVSLMTRLGEDVAFLAICGDPRQSIKKDSLNTLDWTERFLLKYQIEDVGVIHFTEDDCVRSGMVRNILIGLEKEGGYYTNLED